MKERVMECSQPDSVCADDHAIVNQMNPFNVFNREEWEIIAKEMKSSTFVTFREAFPELLDSIGLSTCVEKLFPVVLTVLYKKSYVGFKDVKACRSACSTWKEGIDDYFQTTNFNSVENQNGAAKNPSALVLKVPLELVDIEQINEMELHPRCASFGKKLTLKMQYHWQNYSCRIVVLPIHLKQVSTLMQTVTRLWQHFEHLEVRWPDPRDQRNRRQVDDRLLDIYGEHPEILSENFEWYIRFLHLMTSLKKLTILIEDRMVISSILLHIPKTENFEEIYISPNQHLQCVAVMLGKCAKNLCFWAGATIPYMEILSKQNDGNGYASCCVFEKLKELQILITVPKDLDILEALNDGIIAKMFPAVTSLEVVLACESIREWLPVNLWDFIANFAQIQNFPSLNYFKVDSCMPTFCVDFETLFQVKKDGKLAIEDNPSSSRRGIHEHNLRALRKFQFRCPMHVPVPLIRLFSPRMHVIVGNWPHGCCGGWSWASSDWKYASVFFELFPNVSTLTFISSPRRTITRYRDEERWKMLTFD